MPKIAIIGGGGHAKVLISTIKKLKHFQIIGYTDFNNYGDILGIEYLGEDNILNEYQKSGLKKLAIGIGTINTNDLRSKVYNLFIQKGFEFPKIISPKAIINDDVEIDEASMVFDGVVINSGSKIGKGVILNTNSTIEHDCQIDDFVHIAPSATLSGNVKIGSNSLIGVGATIIQGIEIAENVIIGAGAVVIKKINESGTYVGNPARRIK